MMTLNLKTAFEHCLVSINNYSHFHFEFLKQDTNHILSMIIMLKFIPYLHLYFSIHFTDLSVYSLLNAKIKYPRKIAGTIFRGF